MNNSILKISIFFILMMLEVLSGTFWMESMPIDYCRWIHLASGLGIALLLLLKPGEGRIFFSGKINWVPYGIFIISLIWIIPAFRQMYHDFIVEYHAADMLPVIKIMCQRWLSYQPVYQSIPDIWSGAIPVYLPAMWMPFLPAVLFSFDPRWITIGLTSLGILLVILKKKSSPWSWLVFIPLGLWFDFLLHHRSETYRLSQEGVVYFYCICLLLAIYYELPRMIGLMTALCLLSRYGLIFFLPGVFYCLWKKNGNIFFKRSVLSAFGWGSLLMILSGAWSNLHIFIGLPNQYIRSMESFKTKYQVILDESIGIFPFFPIELSSIVLKIMAGLLILILFLMIRFYKKDTHRFYFLAFLKLSLVIFYNLLIIPFQYLMYTSVVVTFALFYLYSNHEEKQVVI